MVLRETITSPKTGKEILVGGPTYEKLLTSSKWNNIVKALPKSSAKTSPKKAPVKKISPKKIYKKSTSKSQGCSNAGKYKNVPKELFCGPAGGSCEGTYPVNTRGRARAALAYARHAPYPEGIRECVRKVKEKKGW